MKYYNKDYANFVIDDDKEKRLEEGRHIVYNKYLDPKHQEKLARYWWVVLLLWLVTSAGYFALSAYNFLAGRHDLFSTAGYFAFGIFYAIGGIVSYYSMRQTRAKASKKPGTAGA